MDQHKEDIQPSDSENLIHNSSSSSENQHEEFEDRQIDSTVLQDPIHRCIMMLKQASSDTEKFASLLMVTKLIKTSELNAHSSKCLLDAIGLNFLGRMLGTKDVPEGCPPFMFKSIALTVLSCFVSSCHSEPALHRLIPLLAEIIANPELYEDDLTLIKEAYQCLSAIASDTSGRKALIDYEIIGSLVDAYTKECVYHEHSLTIIRNIAVDKECKMWEDEPEAFTKLMNHICKDVMIDQSELKFNLCDALVDVIPSMFEEFDRLSNEGTWKPQLHKGLSDILFSKLSPNLRNKGLQLASVVLEMLGASFIVNGGDKGRQLFLLMVHLACIEVRMSLEDKTFQESVSLAGHTTACYSIIEEAIKFLVNGAIDLEEKQKLQLYCALKGAFNGVLEFLREASTESEVFTGSSKKHQMFTCASVRVLGAWLAEETSANKDEVYQILPFLIKIAKFNFDSNNPTQSKKKGLVKINKEKLPDLLRFLLPGLCHLTAEDIPREILLNLDIESMLFEYLVFQWISAVSFCNEDTIEKIDLSNNSDTMITLCNIFMNLVVQEPKRVQTNMMYYRILKLILSKVPEIPPDSRNLQLSGSFCTLGLMILRHQLANVVSMQKIELTVFRFMQAAVRFLWDAYNVEESTDYATLVVAASYKEHWNDLVELWHLSMHTLTIILPHVPWICSFIVDTEWPQSIIETLLLVKNEGIEAPVKTAYEDFLCAVLQTSKAGETNIQVNFKGIESVCHNHKLDKLKQIYCTRKF